MVEDFWIAGDQYVVYPNLTNPLGLVTRQFCEVLQQLDGVAVMQHTTVGFCYRIAQTPEEFWLKADAICEALQPLGIKQLANDALKAELRREGKDYYWITKNASGLGYLLLNFYLRELDACPPLCVYVHGSAGNELFHGDAVRQQLLPVAKIIDKTIKA